MSFIRIPQEPKKPDLVRKQITDRLPLRVEDDGEIKRCMSGGDYFVEKGSFKLTSFLELLEDIYPIVKDLAHESLSLEIDPHDHYYDGGDKERYTYLYITWLRPETDKEYNNRIWCEKDTYKRKMERYKKDLEIYRKRLKTELSNLGVEQ